MSGQITQLLGRGPSQGVLLAQLEVWTGFDKRTIRRLIERERREGSPILSDNVHGYYLPSTPEEKAVFVRSMRGRAAEIMATADAVENCDDGC
ncbi:MAG: hypothetical protein LUH36_09875 [Oscillospiraceae bacterium]|nr:hypothetical protein [Oscillospiraceae bacterium]